MGRSYLEIIPISFSLLLPSSWVSLPHDRRKSHIQDSCWARFASILATFQEKMVLGFRRTAFSHRIHRKEDSQHLGARTRNSHSLNMEFHLTSFGKKTFSFLNIDLQLFKVRQKKKKTTINYTKQDFSWASCHFPPWLCKTDLGTLLIIFGGQREK